MVSCCQQYCIATLLSWHPGVFPTMQLIFRNIPLSVLFLLTNVFTGILFRICVGPHWHYVAFILMYLCNNNSTRNLSSHTGKMQKGLHCSCFTVQWAWMRECVAHCWWARVMIRRGMQMVSVMVNGNVCCPSLSGRWAPGGGTEKMDRMKIIKRRLSMSLRSARPVDDSLSELAEQMALDEPSAARDNGRIRECVQWHSECTHSFHKAVVIQFDMCTLHLCYIALMI